jgi:copper oxidase (laccase) domain-containing protein
MNPLTFPELDRLGVPHCFTLRQNRIEPLIANVAGVLALHGFDFRLIVQAEQTHGAEVAQADRSHHGKTIPIVDALVTNDPTVTLVIRVADCGPLYFYDPVHKAIGLAHSGKKGSALNIAQATLAAMQQHFGSEPGDMIAVLGPCIHPPDYDIDFPAQIAEQTTAAGVAQFRDCQWNTAADLAQCYSYRKELGKTGRHFAALQLPG